MIVRINLSGETEQRLREIASREGQSLEAYLEQLAVASAAGSASSAPQRTREESVAEWRAWVASHEHIRHVADDSRESIYGDRGE
ncbi:MAG TPA: hypothetical protein VGN42_08900 [Pirellulales bacterium]|jgi:hypothetical protein|nr:hypothetical protein [Pirellulales bacterium]